MTNEQNPVMKARAKRGGSGNKLWVKEFKGEIKENKINQQLVVKGKLDFVTGVSSTAGKTTLSHFMKFTF